MRILDISFNTPDENLALDEVMIESVAAGLAPDTLRTWECPRPFVVIGSGQRIREVVNVGNCVMDNLPILRRCTAGGAVLQGPGCLNFALALSYRAFPEMADLHGSYRFILGRIVRELAREGILSRHEGICDLAVAGLKVSGNAQRRKRDACLHHGTLLYQVDSEAMKRYLIEPGDRPEYRGVRTHAEFVGTVALGVERMREMLINAFAPTASVALPLPEEESETRRLAGDKYRCDRWTYRR